MSGESRLSREELYELVWSEPMLKVAARFGVSSSYMARVCTLLNVPRPERGYWAKLAVGRAPTKPPLPDPCPGDQLEWNRDGTLPKRARPAPRAPERKPRKKPTGSTHHPSRHLLTDKVRPFFESGRLSYRGEYLKPAKKLLVDLVVSKGGLDKALVFANEFFLALEARGHRVMIAPNHERFHRAEVDERENPNRAQYYNNLWSPMRCTVVYIGTVAIGLTVIEMSEEAEVRYVNGKYVRLTERSVSRSRRNVPDYSWTTTRDFPTGRLCLQAYSPYPRTKWCQQWRESKKRDIASQIPSIVRELEEVTPEIVRLFEEGEREAEMERERWEALEEQWRREKEEERIAEALKGSKEELLAIIDAWAAARNLQDFFVDAERRARNLPAEERERLIERLQRARQLVGSIDTLKHFKAWRTPEER